MYQIKQEPVISIDKIVNNDIKIENKILYLFNNYRYINKHWSIKLDNGIWLDLQGGAPEYTSEINYDSDIFEEIKENNEEETE